MLYIIALLGFLVVGFAYLYKNRGPEFSIETLHKLPTKYNSIETGLSSEDKEKAIVLASFCKSDKDYEKLEKKTERVFEKGIGLSTDKAILRNEKQQEIYEYALELAREVLSDIEFYELACTEIYAKLLYEGDKEPRRLQVFKILRDKEDNSEIIDDLSSYSLYSYDFSKHAFRRFRGGKISELWIEKENSYEKLDNVLGYLKGFFKNEVNSTIKAAA